VRSSTSESASLQQPDLGEAFIRDSARVLETRAAQRADHHIVPQRHARKQRRVLKRLGHALARDPVRPQAFHLRAAKHDPPFGRARQPGKGIEQRGFSGAVWPDQTDDFAGLHIESHIRERRETAEPHGHTCNIEQCGHDGTLRIEKEMALNPAGFQSTMAISIAPKISGAMPAA
jgi:hypothetical protein